MRSKQSLANKVHYETMAHDAQPKIPNADRRDPQVRRLGAWARAKLGLNEPLKEVA